MHVRPQEHDCRFLTISEQIEKLSKNNTQINNFGPKFALCHLHAQSFFIFDRYEMLQCYKIMLC